MNPQLARSNLVLAVRALTAVGVRPFLVDGTLLGAVRENGFMEHDKDVDLGVFIESAPIVRSAVEAAGLRHTKTYGTPERGFQHSFRRYGIKLDTFFYYQDNGELYHAAWKDGTPIRYGYPTFELAPITFLGAPFLAPENPERFLEIKYGPDWRTPVKEWDWAWGPKNARAWVEQ